MKNDYNFTKNDDLEITPSEKLNRETIAKMDNAAAESSERSTSIRRIRVKRLVSCVALIGLVFMLMSVGYRTFSYFSYVPGKGITFIEQEMVYTLKEAVNINRNNYIEAVSIVPVSSDKTEGKAADQWEITLITTYLNGIDSEVSIEVNGTDYPLTYSSGGSDLRRFKGIIPELSKSDKYLVKAYGEEVTIEMLEYGESLFTQFSYPIIYDGITWVCFPVAEGSNLFIYDIVVEPENEDITFWAENSGRVSPFISLLETKVIDVNGKEYDVTGGHGTSIPADGATGLLANKYAKMESYFMLSERLEAPVAEIRTENIV
ncbi:MAG: hypothetical protein E7672_05470, partial [Ruminococcaceae bacterium]|nr:hypothetical protein [Oscillospiraceae bacterium]